ncbi:unnamed protein product, partial [Brassica rapa subsp. trilocularis]
FITFPVYIIHQVIKQESDHDYLDAHECLFGHQKQLTRLQ